jgi:hypothetical protein
MRLVVVDEDASLRGLVDRLAHEIGEAAVVFASLDEVAEIASARRDERGAEVVVLDVDASHAARARHCAATAFPRAAVFAIANGNYEATLTRAITGHRHRSRIA